MGELTQQGDHPIHSNLVNEFSVAIAHLCDDLHSNDQRKGGEGKVLNKQIVAIPGGVSWYVSLYACTHTHIINRYRDAHGSI